MSTALKRLLDKAGSLLTSYLYAVGITLMFIHTDEVAPSSAYVFGYTALAVGLLMVMSLSKKSIWLTLTALAAAGIACLISGWKPISDLRHFINDTENGNVLKYIDQLALAVSVILLLIAYSLTRDRHGVYVMLALAFIVSLVCWFVGVRIRIEYMIMPLIAVSAQFSVSGAIKQTNGKALLSASLIAALLSTWIVPAGGTVFEPLQNASEKVVRSIIEFFNLDRNNVEERRTFNLISYGWRTLYDAFGGPARPSPEEIMRVKSDETLYLRGSVRYTYDNRGWVDETNSSKAGKIKRYMTTGLEGRIYRDQFENAFDLDKKSVLDDYFELKTADVDILSDSLYWSIYTPGRTYSVDSDTLRVYYNNLGEIFASKQLSSSDSYTISYYSFSGDRADLASAVKSSKGGVDRAYQAARLLNRDVPEGIDSRLFEVVRQIIAGKNTEYEMAQAICDYLRTNGTYTLNARYVPEGRDFVSYFVLSDMHGYCMHFAAAMTLMARIAGLPARYVEGYLCVPDENGLSTVTGLNAHAWSEVYFEGFGWVTFEATPSEGNSDNAGSGNDGADNDNGSGNTNDGFENQDGDNTPEPTPTPTPEPTPTPNNWEEPDDSDDSWTDEQPDEQTDPDDDPSDQDEEEQDEDEEDEDTPPNGDDRDEPKDDPEQNQQEDKHSGKADAQKPKSDHAAIILLIIALFVLCSMIALCYWRLKQSDPEVASKHYRSNEDKILIWYKACLIALDAQGLSYNEGYTPASFAEKALNMHLADENFVTFSREVSGIRYSERISEDYSFETAKLSYQGITHIMKHQYRLRWYRNRIKNKLGSIEQVP